jgi:hypothetical protein
LNKQAENFNKIVAQISADSGEDDFLLEQTPAAYINPLENVSQVEVFNALMKGSRKERQARAEAFYQILATLEFLKNQKETTRQQFSEFLQTYNRYQKAWNENVKAIRSEYDSFAIQDDLYNVSIENDKFLIKLRAIVHGWSQGDKPHTYQVVKTNLLDPIRSLCQKIADPRAARILPLVINSYEALDNLSHLKSSYSKLAENQATDLMASGKKLLKSVEFFSQHGTI